jgi:hypothetical protein
MELADLQKKFESITIKKDTEVKINPQVFKTIERIKDMVNHLEFLIKYPEEANNVK